MSNDIKFSIETITPEDARRYLTGNIKNRPISVTRVRRYAAQMDVGGWQLNGQPVILNGRDRLLDGQHRLLAVIEHGKPVVMTVCRGVTEEAFRTIDTGKGRNAADLISMEGGKNCTALASSLRYLWKWEHDCLQTRGPTTSKVNEPAPFELLDMFKSIPEMQEITNYITNRKRGFNYIMPGPFGFCMYLFRQIDPIAADTFFRKLVSGLQMNEGDGTYALRQRLIKRKLDKDSMNGVEFAAITIKAWNAERTGRHLRVLVWKKSESFPVPA